MDTGFSDGFMHYLYGVICKRLKLEEEALKSFENAVDLFPLNWSAWQELLSLTTHKLILSKLRLPDHWIKTFFLAHAFLELQAMDAALDACQALFVAGFRRSLHVWTLVAVAHNSNRDSEESLEVFQLIRNIDPYRLDSLDVLSNLLYTNDDKKGLERLAQQVLEIDRFKAETCVIVGNHYSLREAFDKAAMYFHRALKINPECLSAWTLLGHVYMEMKQQNVNAAIQCYRSAIDVNPRDYRWAVLLDKLKRKKESAEAFLKFISLGCEQDGCEAEFLPIAYKSVAEYMIESGNLVDARKYLNLLSTSSKRKEVREDSKALVKRFREMKAALAASGESSASIGDDEPEIPDDACADVEMEVETPTR
ncbi:unnamed protein product [Notodromas monacha]|uniref:Cdc23 domain-containing protein n=1 Tax=Notodromas monacha TaxID=399045 RepID=A0A7R9C2T3_9CRUS|nr:unnamed protein product [Notodromas monacha]CAG0925412.1 unnamed protein product [Notodromas monacha]